VIKLFSIVNRLKRIKSPYIILGIGFVIWMLLFDTENFIIHYKMRMKLKDLAKEKRYYIDQISLIKKEKERISGDMKELEKFARERYFMKRKNEDLYIIQEN
jgi:cell division protein DivIC